MNPLRGRLTGHFLGRVVLLIAALACLFMVWMVLVVNTIVQAQRDGSVTPPTTMLRDAVAETTLTPSGAVVGAKTLRRLDRQGQWLQVLDETGMVIAAYGAPRGAPTHYTPGRLVQARQRPAEMGMLQVFTWYGDVGGHELTYVLGKTGPKPKPPLLQLGSNAVAPSRDSTVTLVGGFLLAGAITTLLVAWLSGSALSRPLVHMMDWLRGLAAGDYAEPLDRDGHAASRAEGGVRRRGYRTYREVFDALDTLTGQLSRNEREREQLERAREEWMSGVSHDLRTPLSSVRGYAEVLASDYDFDPGEVRRQAAVIRGQADHMDAMLDDLNLTFRLRADALPLARECVDLVELARDAAVELANDPRAAGREIAFEDATSAVTAEVDGKWLGRALRNLLVNAAVHNPPGTTVRVSVAREGADAVVTVADDGRGMDADTLAHLFDRYYRGTSTEHGAEGSGLGMAIARQLVEAHGGSVDVTSEPDAGTTVHVRVPAT